MRGRKTKNKIVIKKMAWMKEHSDYAKYAIDPPFEPITLSRYLKGLRRTHARRETTPKCLIDYGILVCSGCNKLLPLELKGRKCIYCGEIAILRKSNK